ncbi:amidohydrolase family protein [Saprospiraceae bacterium]|nr:amidohydrolase family protein [Saprospiraceae bacterium]
MRQKLSADYIFDGEKLHQNAVLVLESEKVVALRPKSVSDEISQFYKGLLMPGFINTHCHLELSHMANKVATGTGLLTFLRSVVSMRDVDQKIVMDAIAKQDQYMWNQGIQAVGDISNKADTAATKAASKIQYYTFVEMFDLLQDGFTENSYAQYYEAYKGFDSENGNNRSAVPHAPYTVTKALFEKINLLNTELSTISIHNQETPDEDQYFIDKSGGFTEFYSAIGINDEQFSPIGKQSIYYAMENMDAKQKTLFVHNTLTTSQNIRDTKAWNEQVYWATCANANLYIENALPNYEAFIAENAKVTIGTDSLTSNWQLSILEELKTIQKFNSFIPTGVLLKWATKNGAEALSFDNLGSFEKDKTPGVILLEEFDGISLQNCEVKRIY